jgi:hypothetical protein
MQDIRNELSIRQNEGNKGDSTHLRGKDRRFPSMWRKEKELSIAIAKHNMPTIVRRMSRETGQRPRGHGRTRTDSDVSTTSFFS